MDLEWERRERKEQRLFRYSKGGGKAERDKVNGGHEEFNLVEFFCTY